MTEEFHNRDQVGRPDQLPMAGRTVWTGEPIAEESARHLGAIAARGAIVAATGRRDARSIGKQQSRRG